MCAIGTLKENSLHAALKAWLSDPDDQQEVRVDGYYIDILTTKGELVEIQTRSFNAMKTKINALIDHHTLRLVYPVAVEKWVIRLENDLTTQISRRKSPRKGSLTDLFYELTSFPVLVSHPNFRLEVLLTRQEELLCREAAPGAANRRRSWRRRGWQIFDRRLLEVVGRQTFTDPLDFLNLLPASLASPFSTRQLAAALHQSIPVAQKMVYCLRKMDQIRPAGFLHRAPLYEIVPGTRSQ